MVQPDPSLGISASFDAAQFKNAIRFAMQMGTPPDVDKRAVFIKKSDSKTYWKNDVEVLNPRLDRDRLPLDPEIVVLETADEEISVDCAIEITKADGDELPVGTMRSTTKATVTVLDDQYALIKGAQELRYNGDIYKYGYEPEGLGLFTVGINTLIFYAEQES